MKTPEELKHRDLVAFLDAWHEIQGASSSVMIGDLLDTITGMRWLSIHSTAHHINAKAVGLWLRGLAQAPIRRDPRTVYHIQFSGRSAAGMRWRLIREQDDTPDSRAQPGASIEANDSQ